MQLKHYSCIGLTLLTSITYVTTFKCLLFVNLYIFIFAQFKLAELFKGDKYNLYTFTKLVWVIFLFVKLNFICYRFRKNVYWRQLPRYKESTFVWRAAGPPLPPNETGKHVLVHVTRSRLATSSWCQIVPRNSGWQVMILRSKLTGNKHVVTLLVNPHLILTSLCIEKNARIHEITLYHPFTQRELKSFTMRIRAGDHVTFVYGNIVSQQIVFAIFSINRSNFY